MGWAGNIVGALTRDEQASAGLQGQHVPILEQHERLAHRLARDRAVIGRPEQVETARKRTARRLARLEQAEAQLDRSEEHTSELQSLMRISYAVFCLKKKNKKQ